MGVLELSYAVLMEPARALSARPRPLVAAAVLLLATLASASASAMGVPMPFSALLLLAGVLLGILGWLVRAAAWRFAAELLGATGSAGSLLSASALAQLPRLLAAPAALLGLTLGYWAGLLLSLGIGLWVLVLNVLAVRETQGLGTGLSLLAVLLPYMLLGAVFFSALALAGVALVLVVVLYGAALLVL